MESDSSKKRIDADAPSTFATRFEFHWRDAVCVGVVALLIWGWVCVRGRRASEGLLGRPLRVGIVAWPGYAAGLVANNGLLPNKDSDFWRNRSLLVEFVPVEDETVLRSELARGGENGGLDVIWSTVDSLALEYPKLLKVGVKPRAFLQVDWSRGGDAIVVSSGIQRIEDLKGKQVAVSMAASLWLLEYSLENSSVSPEDRTQIRNRRIQTKGSPEALDLFVRQNVDAAVLWEPDVSQALTQRAGAGILVDTGKAGHLIADVMVADEKFIRQEPKVIAAFIEGWLLDGTTKAIGDPTAGVPVDSSRHRGPGSLRFRGHFMPVGDLERRLRGHGVWPASVSGNAVNTERHARDATAFRLWLCGPPEPADATHPSARHHRRTPRNWNLPRSEGKTPACAARCDWSGELSREIA
jgi:ABC-type amino acid transport substrate-binding protein